VKPNLTALILLAATLIYAAHSSAQELAPRAYWPAPSGLNLFVTGYQYSSGDVLTDPSVPIEGVEADINFLSLTYMRTFDLAGRTANLQLNLPYTWGDAQGLVEGAFRARNISTIADARARISVNLVGAPAMDGAGFQALRQAPRPILGASVLVSMPTGEYDATKLFNAGTNRWAIKPALGFIYPLRRTLLFEIEVATWIFGDNDDYLGARKDQDELISVSMHLVRRIRPGFWASIDLNHYEGGRNTIGGVRRNDRQENSRAGATLVWPFKRSHALRMSASTGISTSAGGDFSSFTIAYAYA
jgi:hypothetical protein